MRLISAFLMVLTLFGTTAIAKSQSLEPIEKWEKRHSNWASDQSELGYISARCGALYGVIGATFRNFGGRPEDAQKGSEIIVRGLLLTIFGNQFSERIGWTKERLEQRFKDVSDKYLEVVSSNRTIHNNMFHGFVEGDWKFCIELEAMLKEVATNQKK